MNPSGGVGGIHAIHDAVTLANWLSTLRLADDDKLEEVFKEYRAERYPVAKAAFATSQMFTYNFGKVLNHHYIAIMKRCGHPFETLTWHDSISRHTIDPACSHCSWNGEEDASLALEENRLQDVC